MNGAIVCVGRLREKYFAGAAEEYLKRLSRFGKMEMIELPDLLEPQNASDAQRQQVMDKEAAALMKHIRPDDFVVCLCIKADAPDSVRLAKLTSGWAAAAVTVSAGASAAGTSVRRGSPCSMPTSRPAPAPITTDNTSNGMGIHLL